MKRFLLCFAFVIAFVLVAVCSCELIYEAKDGKPSIERVNILVYGNDYAGSTWQGEPVNPLLGTVNDATQVGLAFEALAKENGLECSSHYILGKNSDKKGVGFAYTIPNAIEHPDTNTKMSNFKAAIEEIAANSTEKDLTVVYVSCHGYYDAVDGVKSEYGQEEDTYFVTCANTGDECELYSHKEFLEDVSKIKGVKLIMADVCHSGGIVNPSYVSVDKDAYENASAAWLFVENEKMEVDSSMFCLSAARYYEKSYEYIKSDSNYRTHGYFTLALLDALGWDGEKFTGDAKAARDGRLTFLGLSSYIAKNDGCSEQNPMFSGGSNDVVLFSF